MKGHHKRKEGVKEKDFLFYSKWFLIWTLIYSILYIIFEFLLGAMLGNSHFFQIKFFHILILGLCFSISSRIIYSLIHKSTIYMGTDVFFFWTIVYGLSIWFFEFLKGLFISQLAFSILTNQFVGFFFIGLGVNLSINLIKKMEFNIKTPRLKAPSQIIRGIILVIIGILCWRFSELVFINWIGWAEGMAWSWLIGICFIIGGFLTLLAWWRNNVLQHRIGIKFGHWN
jgi:hypothetical protein